MAWIAAEGGVWNFWMPQAWQKKGGGGICAHLGSSEYFNNWSLVSCINFLKKIIPFMCRILDITLPLYQTVDIS